MTASFASLLMDLPINGISRKTHEIIAAKEPGRIIKNQQLTNMVSKSLPVLGWREWIALPDLDIHKLQCKVDTGATTSALHAHTLERFVDDGVDKVRFLLHPKQRSHEYEVSCVADIIDEREVSDSGGHREMRLVIRTRVVLGQHDFETDFTLTGRDTMMFRMLLGRSALKDRFLVDSAKSFSMGRL